MNKFVGIAQLPLNLKLLISLVAGGANTLAFAPFDLWPIALATPIVLFLLLSTVSPKEALQIGASYGLGWFGIGVSWVHVSIDTYGGMPLIASLLLMLLLVAYLSIYPALACWLTVKLSNHQQRLVWLFPAVWTCTEYLRGHVFTGFPWLSLGYSQISSPLSSLAPIIGEIGITYVLLTICAMIASFAMNQLSGKRFSLIIGSAIGLTVISSQMTWVNETGKQLRVALVQGNIEQSLRWEPEKEWPTMLKYRDLTRPHYDVDLIVWPEAAIPALEHRAQDYLHNLDSALKFNQTSLITGILDYDVLTDDAYNNLIVLGAQQDDNAEYYYQNNNRFSKHHLLPIGEFVPFESFLRQVAPLFDLPMSSFTRGEYIQSNLIANGLNITPAICYEIVFSDQVKDNFTDTTDLLLTVSNDAWFGASHGPAQHMQIAQMRALELGRPLLRATNTGVTATVDANGKIIARLEQFKEAVLTSEVNMVKGATPFSVTGNLPVYLLSLVITLITLATKFYRARVHGSDKKVFQ